MIQIQPISDLGNKFTEIEDVVKEGEPVYFTKNGYGCNELRKKFYYILQIILAIKWQQ